MATNDVDEDYISCHVCLTRYDDEQRKPKFLDCHHSFCMSCIKDLSAQKQRLLALRNVDNNNAAVCCPICRHPTNLAGRNIDELATNNLALRLLAIETKNSEESLVLKQASTNINKVKMWCVDCESLGSAKCQDQAHIMYEYQQVYSEQLILLEGQANLCHPHFERAIEERQTAQTLYLQVQDSLRTLMAEITKRIEYNDSQIAIMQSTIQEITDLPIIPSNEDSTEDEYLNTIEQMKETATRFASLNTEASVQKMTAVHQLNLLKKIEESRVDLNLSKAFQPIGSLKNLQLSLSGGNHADPNIKACISVLTFLTLFLAEKEATLENDLANESVDSMPSPGAKEEIRKKTEPAPKATGARPKLAKRAPQADSQQPSASNNSKNPQSVAKLNSQPEVPVHSKFYFRFSINGEITKQVIFQLEPKIAPVMCSKFALLCSGKEGPGYRGTSIFKVNKNHSVTGGFVDNEADKEWRQKFFYIADRSALQEKRGSIRMHINRIVDWKAEVSTEFLIILEERRDKRKFTTVFGQIIEGLAVCDKISQLNLEKFKVVVAECGPC